MTTQQVTIVICPQKVLNAETVTEIQSALLRRTWQLIPKDASKEERNAMFGMAREQAAFEFASQIDNVLTVEEFESKLGTLRNIIGKVKQTAAEKNGNGKVNGHAKALQPPLVVVGNTASAKRVVTAQGMGAVRFVSDTPAPAEDSVPSLHSAMRELLKDFPVGKLAVIPFETQEIAGSAQGMLNSAAKSNGWTTMEDGSMPYMSKIVGRHLYLVRLQ